MRRYIAIHFRVRLPMRARIHDSVKLVRKNWETAIGGRGYRGGR
jgi:hypothetical protein